MSVNLEDMKKLNLKNMGEMVPLPLEWAILGYSEFNSLNGKGVIVKFLRPEENPISLFGHSLENRDGKWFVRADHLEKQLEHARKFE